MKIIIEIENSKDFSYSNFIEWLNSKLEIANRDVGTNYWARYIGTEEEDDEND